MRVLLVCMEVVPFKFSRKDSNKVPTDRKSAPIPECSRKTGGLKEKI
jgi:hypothetical protein